MTIGQILQKDIEESKRWIECTLEDSTYKRDLDLINRCYYGLITNFGLNTWIRLLPASATNTLSSRNENFADFIAIPRGAMN